MTPAGTIFHLAIPSSNLEASVDFYTKLGCRIARRYGDRVALELLGHQIECHLCPEKVDHRPTLYPRHFGITFLSAEPFEQLLALAQERTLEFFDVPFVRFGGRHEEHRSFVLRDPSNNLLEFKLYRDPSVIF